MSHSPDDRPPTRTPSWRRYVRFGGARVDADVDDELAFHTEMRVRDYIARGMTERDARAAASARLGDLHDVRDDCLTIGHRRQRRMTRTQLLEALAQDIRYALRTLNRQKAWSAVAIVTLALGIGASTAVFTVVNSLLLHPLAYRDADRLAMIWRVDTKSSMMIGPDRKMIDLWRAQSHTVEAIETFETADMTLTGTGEATLLHTAAVRPEFGAFTGLAPIVGRSFVHDDDDEGKGGLVAMLSESLWRQRFGARTDVPGTRVTLNDKIYTVIGVVPSAYRLPLLGGGAVPDVWLSLGRDTMGFGGLTLARIRPGVASQAASQELDRIVDNAKLSNELGSKQFVAKLVKPGEMIGFRSSLFLLAGAVVLLLLVACANVAHLLLARGATRERELAIRTALGAGGWRLTRQLLTESSVLAGFGCAVGIALGYAGVRVLLALRPKSLNELALTQMDSRALIAAVVLSAITGIVFGLTAAFHAVRHSTSDSLRATALSGTAIKRSHRVQSLLVVTEMALSALLLVGAVLLVRSVVKLQHVDPGFDSANLYSMRVDLPRTRYVTGPARAAFVADVVMRTRAIPGITAVTVADAAPPGMGSFMFAKLAPEFGISSPPSFFATNRVAPNFFSVAGLRLTHGSTFTDGASKRSEVIVNEGLAKRLWPGQSAVGRRIRFVPTVTPKPGAKPDDGLLVVAVAADVPTRGLSRDRGEPIIYYPAEGMENRSSAEIIVRIAPGVDPVAPMRAAVMSLDSHLAPPPVRNVDVAIAETIGTQRFTMTLLAVFAGLAVLLSAVGLYGVISYVVTQRTREIGIRIALGATPRQVARTIVARGVILSFAGLAVGLAVAVWGTKLIRSTLYGVTGTDPLSYAATAIVLLAISLMACFIPMRRAMAVDPVIAMRGD